MNCVLQVLLDVLVLISRYALRKVFSWYIIIFETPTSSLFLFRLSESGSVPFSYRIRHKDEKHSGRSPLQSFHEVQWRAGTREGRNQHGLFLLLNKILINEDDRYVPSGVAARNGLLIEISLSSSRTIAHTRCSCSANLALWHTSIARR